MFCSRSFVRVILVCEGALTLSLPARHRGYDMCRWIRINFRFESRMDGGCDSGGCECSQMSKPRAMAVERMRFKVDF